MEDLTPTYEVPTFQAPDAPTQLFEIIGMFPMVTSIPTWVPKTFQQSFAIDTANAVLYFYDYTNNLWHAQGAVKVVALIDGATPALDASQGSEFTLSAGGDRTIAIPTNPTDGQKIVIRHYASGGARTLSLNSGAGGFAFGSDITGLTQTASGKTDYIGCIYSATASLWHVVAVSKGY